MMYLADMVLPAPLSPLTTIVWFFRSRIMHRYASSATAKRCGSSSPFRRPAYAWMISGLYRFMAKYGFTAISTMPEYV